jgi:hypothetical protein
MAYSLTEGRIGWPAITTRTSTAPIPVGSRTKAYSSDYGEGEFIYLIGVASTTTGDMVTYNTTTYQSALSLTTAAQGAPVAVAMGANLAGSYGWYQVGGNAVIKKTAINFAPGVKVYVGGTAGRIKSTASAGKLVQNAKSANLASVASATSTIVVLIERPYLRGVTSAI